MVTTSATANPTITQNSQHNLWETFERLLLFISMGVLVISLALILHSFVDKWVPKTNQSFDYFSSFNASVMRGYIAAIIVSYPLFSFFFLRISKRIEKNTYIQDMRSRKLLIYITLIITFIILLFNIIQIIYGFLNGNVTMNFVFHFLVSVIISAVIFSYYLYQVRGDRKIYD